MTEINLSDEPEEASGIGRMDSYIGWIYIYDRGLNYFELYTIQLKEGNGGVYIRARNSCAKCICSRAFALSQWKKLMSRSELTPRLRTINTFPRSSSSLIIHHLLQKGGEMRFLLLAILLHRPKCI